MIPCIRCHVKNNEHFFCILCFVSYFKTFMLVIYMLLNVIMMQTFLQSLTNISRLLRYRKCFIRFSLKIFWNRRHKNFVCLPEISFLLSVHFSPYNVKPPLLGGERRNFVIDFCFCFFYKHENLSSRRASCSFYI